MGLKPQDAAMIREEVNRIAWLNASGLDREMIGETLAELTALSDMFKSISTLSFTDQALQKQVLQEQYKIMMVINAFPEQTPAMDFSIKTSPTTYNLSQSIHFFATQKTAPQAKPEPTKQLDLLPSNGY